MASYGIELVWAFLSDKEKMKLRNVQKVMSTSKYNSNTYVYMLVEESLFVTDLKDRFSLPET
jgi:hypothetical protein